MSKLARLFSTCLLVLSMCAATFADGGDTQGPGFAPPAHTSECNLVSRETVAPASEQDSLADLATVVIVPLILLAEVIL